MTASIAPVERVTVTDDDLPFLRALFASTRAAEAALLSWSEAQKSAFLAMQFDAQQRSYECQYPGAEFNKLICDGKDIGRLSVAVSTDELHLIDISLLPKYRDWGIGTALLQDLQNQSRQLGIPLRLSVDPTNPALRLYTRLGFTLVTEHPMYLQMEWRPEAFLPLPKQD